MLITKADVLKLHEERSPQARVDIAQKIVRGFNSDLFGPESNRIAKEIMRLLMHDTEIMVRKSLAEHLKHNLEAPHDVIRHLANDTGEVAVPLLEHSYVLSEEDLVEIVRSTNEVIKLEAVTRRECISAELAQALLSRNNEDLVLKTLLNNGAAISEDSVWEVIQNYFNSEAVLDVLVKRGGFSLKLAEKLFTLVSDEMKTHLAKKFNMSRHVIDTLSQQAREHLTLSLATPENADKEDVMGLVEHLHGEGRLSESLVLRALCTGDLRFFEASLACLANIPVLNARMLVIDPGGMGFSALYEACNLPQEYYTEVKAILDIAMEETEYGRYHRQDYQKRIRDRVTAAGYHMNMRYMPYLMSIISREANGTATVH